MGGSFSSNKHDKLLSEDGIEKFDDYQRKIDKYERNISEYERNIAEYERKSKACEANFNALENQIEALMENRSESTNSIVDNCFECKQDVKRIEDNFDRLLAAYKQLSKSEADPDLLFANWRAEDHTGSSALNPALGNMDYHPHEGGRKSKKKSKTRKKQKTKKRSKRSKRNKSKKR